MEWVKIKKVLEAQPQFRFKQLKRALFIDLVSSFEEISNFPKQLREELAKDNSLEIKSEIFIGKKSLKAVLTLADDLKVETVAIKNSDGKVTICLSSQVGCPLACSFCATGQSGWKRNLTFEEILDQVRFWAQREKISHVVFMGMGEPFLNYQAVMEAVKFINDPEAFGIGARKISISTVGLPAEIEKLAHEKIQVNLAVSWHASHDLQREKIMPIARKYSLAKVLKSLDFYYQKQKRQIMIEYLLLARFNDSIEDARLLAETFRGREVVINLLTYNPTCGRWQASPNSQVESFKDYLQSAGLKVSQRRSWGEEIEAACGQLNLKRK